MKSNRREIVEAMSEKYDVSRRQADEMYGYIFESIKESLIKNGKFSLVGFGMFKIKTNKARVARNPKTGEAIKLPARKVIKFQMKKSIRDDF